MSEDPIVIDAEAVEEPAMAEQADAVADFMPQSEELAIRDVGDTHEVAIVMDRHDVEMILDRVQGAALEKWIYKLPGRDGKMGLSIHGVQDIVQLMNWMGKCRLTILEETLEVERMVEDLGDGPEPMWVATVFAKDEMTGLSMPGTSTEPVMMQLKEETAAKKRSEGKTVRADGKVFDPFSRAKAVNKAYRNAFAAHIPEVVEQTIIAAYAQDPSRVRAITTPEQAKAEARPQALDTDEARALMARCDELYAEIKAIGPKARLKYTPGTYHAHMVGSHHDMAALERFVGYLETRLAEMPAEILLEEQQADARETWKDVLCPVCESKAGNSCVQLDADGQKVMKGDKPAWMNRPHPERLQARLAAIQGAS